MIHRCLPIQNFKELHLIRLSIGKEIGLVYFDGLEDLYASIRLAQIPVIELPRQYLPTLESMQTALLLYILQACSSCFSQFV